MSVDAVPASCLKMIHPKFILGLPETFLNRPPRKTNPQQPLQCNAIAARNHIRDKIFDLLAIEHIADNNEIMCPAGKSVISLFTIQPGVLDFPDHRPAVAVFDVKFLPFLFLEKAGIYQQIAYLRRRQRLG